MTNPNSARPGLSPQDVAKRVTSLAAKIAGLLDRLDGKAEPSWRDDMDVSIAWRLWMVDAREAYLDPVAPLLAQMPDEHYDRAYEAVFKIAKATGLAGRPQSSKRYLDLHLASLRTIPLVEAGELLGIGRNRCYELAKSGAFPVPVREVVGKLRVSSRSQNAFEQHVLTWVLLSGCSEEAIDLAFSPTSVAGIAPPPMPRSERKGCSKSPT